MTVYVYMYYMLVRLSGCLNHIKGTIIIIIIIIIIIHVNNTSILRYKSRGVEKESTSESLKIWVLA